ncbi:RHS repeat-associated core domain-containing protein [Sphingobacterium spiritivorum]|uniref:RHS repeat-associated core domain-containing protein n=1 Tax=Sphingobacterium spiritivorum TaxID=258 RepID=UPI003DA6C0DE
MNTSISDFFSLKLKYGDGNTPQWNGNISEQQWGQTVSPGEKFVYEYDQLSRLKNGTSPSGMSELLNYDEMGNITKLIRDGTSIDYTYSGNKLSMVSGTVNGNYAYDNNGNVSADRNGLNYVYTHFNIPKAVNGNGKTISYLYDANGIKLRKISNETGRRDYIGNIEYQNGNIALIRHAEGVAILKTDGTYIYHYNLNDHLGNVRATLYRNPATNQVEALQRDDYYPFGLRKVLKGGNNKYLYNGKEIQGELGDQYDYGARFYDPVIARWGMVDPLAEIQPNKTPYHYTSNNPINRIDPTGMLDGDYYDKNGKYLGNDGIDDNKVYQLKDNYRAKFENTDVNWGGILSEKHYTELQTKSNDLGTVQDAFVTGDVVSDKRIQGLHPAIRMQATDFIKEANANSSSTMIRVADGFRTYAEQDALYAQGRTASGSIVTKAKGGYSNHNFGLAFDIVGVTKGKTDYNLDWKSLSTLGKSKGLEWGGDWKFKDMPHFQNMFGNGMKDLRALPKDKKGFPILKP